MSQRKPPSTGKQKVHPGVGINPLWGVAKIPLVSAKERCLTGTWGVFTGKHPSIALRQKAEK